MSRLLLPLLLLVALGVNAAVDPYQFDSEEQRVRYLEFTRELRCPKCQNQNLADSNAPIAADLRHELQRLLHEGRSDSEIIDFMVERYGEYVLYEPRLEPKTVLLWTAPVLMLLGGVLVLAGVLRRARRAASGRGDALAPDEQARLRQLLHDEVLRPATGDSDAIIMSAAPADYRPANPSDHKMKKGADDAMTVELAKNPDIIASLPGGGVRVGFAAETRDLAGYAKAKIPAKRLDFIVANDVSAPGSGFGTDTNQVTIFYREGHHEEFPLMAKYAVAMTILDRVRERLG